MKRHMADVVIPQIGESVTEGTIGRWFFKEGDLVQKDQPLLEIDSDKATLEVPASASGRLKILVPQGKVAQVGSKIAEIVPSEAAGTSTEASSSSKTASSTNVTPLPTSKAPTPSTSPSAPAASSAGASASYGAPAGATAAAWSEEDLADLTPSQRKAARHGEFVKPQGNLNVVLDPSADAVRTPMTTLRKRIAERLLQSQQTTATLTTFNEIDMSNAMKIRSELKDQFEKQHQVKLGFMSFFSKAVLYAMEQYPDMNAHIEGTEIVAPRGVHLGIAVSTTRGLVVPVIRNAESLNFSQLEKRILDLAEKARTGKLSIPEMQGGTFTITNGGVFGSLLSTPILNPPQSGILGMHKIEHRPIAIEKSKGEFSIEVRPMMYVALSYDHRLIDGSTSVGFLVKVKEYLEKVVTRDAVL